MCCQELPLDRSKNSWDINARKILPRSSELPPYSFRSVLVAFGYSQRLCAGCRFTPSAIPESIKNSSEKVLVMFAYWGYAGEIKREKEHARHGVGDKDRMEWNDKLCVRISFALALPCAPGGGGRRTGHAGGIGANAPTIPSPNLRWAGVSCNRTP